MSGDAPWLDVEELLHPEEQQRFRLLCMETSADELDQLVEVVQLHLGHLNRGDHPVADTETAHEVGAALVALLASGEGFDAGERALIRGAVEYFLLTDDASDDLDDALGFDDDARVLNAVLDRIGRPQFRVELS